MDKYSAVASFYNNKTILITGVTGFCGKVFLAKLLRSCPQISTIYVLIRPKNNQSAEQRLAKLLNSRPFTFQPQSIYQVSKVKAIECELSQLSCTISDTNYSKIINEVNIIFHMAACVKFDLSIKEIYESNVVGTKELLNLARCMKQLQCFVHVSTAYSNCHLDTIEEKLYPLAYDLDTIMDIIENTDSTTLAEFHDNLSQCRPNSYVFVKAIAEHLIHRLAKPELPNYRPIPVALIRPSIVLPAVSEPVPGWVDSINGPLSMLLLSSVGIMVTSNYDYAIRPDTISVDHLANFMLCAAWFQCSKCKPTNYHHENSVTSELVTVKNYASDTNIFMDESLDINDLLGDKISPLDTNTDETDGNFTIYNFTASGLNSSTTSCHDLLKYGHEICLSSPSLWTIRPNTVPSINNNKPGWMFSIEKFVYHFLYALLLDIMFWLTGHKPRLVRYVQKMHKGMEIMRFFAVKEWHFRSENTKSVLATMSSVDHDLFNVDTTIYQNLPKYINILWRGSRRYLLKDSDSSITTAKRNYIIISILYHVLVGLVWYTLGIAACAILGSAHLGWILAIAIGINMTKCALHLYKTRQYLARDPYNIPEPTECKAAMAA